MSCHLVTSAGGPALCGRREFREDQPGGTCHTYVEVLGRNLHTADCRDCLRKHHQNELRRLDQG